MEYLAELLRAWREDNGIAQEEVAIMIGVRMQTYRNWEGARYRPSAENLAKIETTTGLKIDISKLAEE